MQLLVLGANGLLGSNVVRACLDYGGTVAGTYHSTEPRFDIPLHQLDITDAPAVAAVIDDVDPDWVVNCVAMTDVDGCEQEPDRAHAVNAVAPGAIARLCAEADRGFLHVSTDYVFDGAARGAYSETATPNPVQVYGESKLAGERAVRAESKTALILRLSFVWGVHRGTSELTGFPAWVYNRFRSSETVPLFTDQWVTPTRAGQAADTLLALVEQDAGGLYHVACASCVTPYEFGEVLAERVGSGSNLLRAGSTDDVERAATRPTYTCLDVEKVEAALKRPQPTLRDDVEAIWDEVT